MSTCEVSSGGGGKPPTEIVGGDPAEHAKIDRITALQDGIDSLSLAMFEALRGLRDAVAPESGNLGGAQSQDAAGSNSYVNSPGENEFEEFLQSYRNGDPETVAMVQKVTNTTPQRADDLRRIHAKIEKERDTELVVKLATTVLEKSAEIDLRVSTIPGMHRTRVQQMEYIEELLEMNRQTTQKLEETYTLAEERRDRVRKFVKDHTCEALGIFED